MKGRRTRKQQLTAIAAIIVGVFAISIGFAAFSSTLNIRSSATVNPDASAFAVIFSSDANSLKTDAVVANPSNLGDSATIDNSSNPTISGLNAKFTAPNQSVTYTFYARNTGEFLAYLNYITFTNVEGASSNKVCTASDGTSQALVDQACNGISMSVKVGDLEEVTTSQNNIQNHTLAPNTSEVVTVTISYAENAALADGPFEVSFGDISLIYSSINNNIDEELEQIPKPVSFADDDWSTIAANIQAGDLSKYNVGETKEISLTGFTNTESDSNGLYTIRIANTSTPSECSSEGFSQTACGFVIVFEDIITTHTQNETYTNIGGYPASSMYTYIQNDIYNALPYELKEVIIPTYVVSGHGSTPGEENFVTEQDKLYLLTGKEIYGSDSNDTSSNLTRQLEYYSNLGVTTNNVTGAIKKLNGSAIGWWLRSAGSGNTTAFNRVRSGGGFHSYGATADSGVAVAFRIG